jgi:hypothetical protein
MDVSSNGMFQYRNTAFRAHPSLSSNCSEIKNDSLSKSPELKCEDNSTKISENETCRTIVSMLINQRKISLGLEQQLKSLQSTNKTKNIPNSSTESNSILYSINDNNQRSNLNQLSNIKRFSLDEHQQRNFIFLNSQHHFLTHSLSKKILFILN